MKEDLTPTEMIYVPVRSWCRAQSPPYSIHTARWRIKTGTFPRAQKIGGEWMVPFNAPIPIKPGRMKAPPGYLTVAQWAELRGIGQQWARRLIHDGRVPVRWLGGLMYVHEATKYVKLPPGKKAKPKGGYYGL